MNINANIVAIIACLLWSSTFFVIKVGLQYTDPMQFGGMRFFISGLLLIPFCGAIKPFYKIVKDNFKVVVMAAILFTTLTYSLLFIAMDMIPASLCSVIIGSSPLVIAIFSHVLLQNEKLDVFKVFSILIGVLGIVFISINELLDVEVGDLNAFIGGVVIAVLHVISISYSNIFVAKYTKDIPPLILSSSQMTIGGFLLILMSMFFEGFDLSAFSNITYCTSLAWLSFVSAFAVSIWFVLLRTESVKVSSLNFWKFIIPVFGCVLSWIFLPEENVKTNVVTGVFLIAVSLIMLNLPNINSLKRNKTMIKKHDVS
ncbi:DMT family transporter [Ichthyobacterium seriolicida]|uniref:Permease of the drug/metabolite transporter superfamily n=1 Tax=Ichthyobacterium seriolicida TaxID=242600 RepID=A0A1J1E312_9FLAO|nr:DMT family transporter [Ichthyobacterium seriolicida]BAV94420.1 permease of the drug/metabolite transporter superfamily [Ichthyobacterium seriolicida]